MSVRKLLAAAGIIAAGVALAGASPAGAATLKCTSTTSCGGATLEYMAKGPLSLAVLAPDQTVNGGFGYWNEHVGFTTSGATDGTQDFTVFQDTGTGTGVGKGGVYGLGDYVVMYTPGGVQPPAGDTAYCLSVEDTYPVVAGRTVQRWALVLRNCDATGPWGTPAFTTSAAVAPSVFAGEQTVANPDPYQLWAPVEVSGPALEFQDVALNFQSFRHGWGGQNFVLDDRAFGGSGTWGLAFPENDGTNQKDVIDGCTPPITTFNAQYYTCASPA